VGWIRNYVFIYFTNYFRGHMRRKRQVYEILCVSENKILYFVLLICKNFSSKELSLLRLGFFFSWVKVKTRALPIPLLGSFCYGFIFLGWLFFGKCLAENWPYLITWKLRVREKHLFIYVFGFFCTYYCPCWRYWWSGCSTISNISWIFFPC